MVWTWSAENDTIIKALTVITHKKIPLGSPQMRGKDAIEKDITLLGKNVSVELVFERKRQRELLLAAKVLQGPLS